MKKQHTFKLQLMRVPAYFAHPLFFFFSFTSLFGVDQNRDPLYGDQKAYDLLYLESEKETPLMTGNWGGSRDYLKEHGFTIGLSYVTDMLGNPSGGQARGFAYAGSFGLNIDLDFEKACGWTGFEFFSSVVWRTGTNLSARKINNQFPVAQLYGSETVKLNELYLKQRFFDDRFILKAGRLNAGNDFLSSPLYSQFVSNAFDGNPIAIFFNFPGMTAYPNATWGAYLSLKPTPHLFAQFAAYNANTNINKNRYHGINFTFSSTNGVIWITEWAYLLNQETNSSGMPGNYKVGFSYQSGETQQFQNGLTRGNFFGYILIDQMIYQPNGPQTTQGLTPFIALLFTPVNRNLFPFFLTGGLVYTGLFPSRPKDSTNIGIAYGKYSSSLANAQRMAQNTGILGPFGSLPQNFETVLELNHWFQINGWMTFVPDIQYIINPKGFGKIQNALVIGAQIGFIL